MENKYVISAIGLFAFFTALIIVRVFLSRLIRFAHKRNMLDVPSGRKAHKAPTPTSGGIAFGIIAVLLLPIMYMYTSLGTVVVCSLVLLVLGYIDDRYDLSAKIKFLFQIIVASIVIASLGVVNWFETDLVWLNYVITFLFLVGFTNAFNLIDGVDGLAGTYALFVFALIFFLLLTNGSFVPALYVLVLMAGIIGFLKFNLNPAKIFMGDTGSLFLGFSLGVFTLVVLKDIESADFGSLPKSQTQVFCLSLLILPIADTFRVMLLRVLRRQSPFRADRSHLHHMLAKLGFNADGIILCFLAGASLFSVETFVLSYQGFSAIFILMVLLLTATFIFNVLVFFRLREHHIRIRKYKSSLEKIKHENYLLYKTELN